MEDSHSYYGKLTPIYGLKNTMSEHAVTEMVKGIVKKITDDFEKDLNNSLISIKLDSSKMVEILKKDILRVRQRLLHLESKINKISNINSEILSENDIDEINEMKEVKKKIKARGIRVDEE